MNKLLKQALRLSVQTLQCNVSTAGLILLLLSFHPPAFAGLNNVSTIEIIPSSLNYEGWLQISEVIAIETGTGNNLALSSIGATVTGSSDWIDSNSNYAIDGIAPNNFPYIFHSNENNRTSFLRIKLASPSQLDSITLFGRTECCSFRDIYNIRLYDNQGILLYTANDLDATNNSHSVKVTEFHVQITTAPEITAITPTSATLQKLTTFTVTGTNLTSGMGFDVAGCAPKNFEVDSETATASERHFRCMPTKAGNKVGVIRSATSNGKLLKKFSVSVADIIPLVTRITPQTVAFGEEEVFTVTGTNLVPDLNFSLKDCDQIQEVGTGTATERFFQCTPKNNEGVHAGSVSLADGKVLTNFAVDVTTNLQYEQVNARLDLYQSTRLSPMRLFGSFPIIPSFAKGLLAQIPTFSSATPWYVKVNGKKIYSGLLGDSFKARFTLENGNAAIDLKSTAGKIIGTMNFSWEQNTLKYALRGKLPELLAELQRNNSFQNATIEFGFNTTKAIFIVSPDASGNYAATTASWAHDFKRIGDNFYLMPETIALRETLLDKYVVADIESNVSFLNGLNSGTIKTTEIATGLAENLGTALDVIKFSSYIGKDVTKEVKIDMIKKMTSLAVSGSAGYLTESQSKAAAHFLEDFTSSVVEDSVDFASGDFAGVATSLGLSTYETVINAFSAYTLKTRLEQIYAYHIAGEVMKQLMAHEGNIGILADSVLPNVPQNSRSWRRVIEAIGSSMTCRGLNPCQSGVFKTDDYDPNVVNSLVQDYLARLRLLSGYGNIAMHVTP